MSELANKIVDELINGNNAGAKEAFDVAIAAKVTDALQAKKMEVAQHFFKQPEAATETETETDGTEQQASV